MRRNNLIFRQKKHLCRDVILWTPIHDDVPHHKMTKLLRFTGPSNCWSGEAKRVEKEMRIVMGGRIELIMRNIGWLFAWNAIKMFFQRKKERAKEHDDYGVLWSSFSYLYFFVDSSLSSHLLSTWVFLFPFFWSSSFQISFFPFWLSSSATSDGLLPRISLSFRKTNSWWVGAPMDIPLSHLSDEDLLLFCCFCRRILFSFLSYKKFFGGLFLWTLMTMMMFGSSSRHLLKHHFLLIFFSFLWMSELFSPSLLFWKNWRIVFRMMRWRKWRWKRFLEHSCCCLLPPLIFCLILLLCVPYNHFSLSSEGYFL